MKHNLLHIEKTFNVNINYYKKDVEIRKNITFCKPFIVTIKEGMIVQVISTTQFDLNFLKEFCVVEMDDCIKVFIWQTSAIFAQAIAIDLIKSKFNIHYIEQLL